MVNWGILGAGNIAHRFAASLAHVAGAELVAASCRTQEKANRMRAWMESRGIYPSGDAETALSTGAYQEFDDFPHLMQLIESARLGDGERAKKLLGVHPVPVGTMAEVSMEGAALSFEDICFTAP